MERDEEEIQEARERDADRFDMEMRHAPRGGRQGTPGWTYYLDEASNRFGLRDENGDHFATLEGGRFTGPGCFEARARLIVAAVNGVREALPGLSDTQRSEVIEDRGVFVRGYAHTAPTATYDSVIAHQRDRADLAACREALRGILEAVAKSNDDHLLTDGRRRDACDVLTRLDA